ncbi:transport system permease protein [Methanolacinia petrolearia DSM 11571]|uniref:Cobalamin import system permease protein BtuC n=1 Tax=Methanolacinia petrolearia (strain DSM 11571 / OCM 486 / SEBR 4847) TaxID=679926 RepID=E1RI26_METP4|nr:iron ABC transporter permease [Methanolacinia petrolearia]ADN35411.1 transport system permease protein [Methanolacinia petrolearia DSM 11571]
MTEIYGITVIPENETVHSLYKTGSNKRILLISGLAILVVISAIVALCMGTVNLTITDTLLAVGHSCAVSTQDFLHNYLPSIASVYDSIPITIPQPENSQAELIIVGFRLPRILLAIVTGMCLAIAGAVMQGLLRNPLVSPFTLGMSSAASFGAAIAIVLNLGAFMSAYLFMASDLAIVLMAFLFGWASIFLVYYFGRSVISSQTTLILAGVVLGYLFSAAIMFLKYISNDEKLREITLWLMGGMWGASWQAIIILIPITIVCFLILERMAWDLNTLSAGDEVAKNLGINVEKIRLKGLLVSTFAASSCLAFTGIIGFIGLMGPHICRMIIGNDHRYLIPCAALTGAVILLISDTIARTIMSPVELPVGIIMYVIGGIFFMFLLKALRRGIY